MISFFRLKNIIMGIELQFMGVFLRCKMNLYCPSWLTTVEYQPKDSRMALNINCKQEQSVQLHIFFKSWLGRDFEKCVLYSSQGAKSWVETFLSKLILSLDIMLLKLVLICLLPSVLLVASQYHGWSFPFLLDLWQESSTQTSGYAGLHSSVFDFSSFCSFYLVCWASLHHVCWVFLQLLLLWKNLSMLVNVWPWPAPSAGNSWGLWDGMVP
jgi:hypothetical protein